ncbi:MAG TPA: UDP-N-acetylmuramoyl-tripeptide--D-alanyl-D-alanine ligase [Lachnospiraceae bacterium]|nr:UDP-N-acetylmuramoyl-tripeptide--D-alanyl-D-alanine ligase [Lachnospiraceae bacterium]
MKGMTLQKITEACGGELHIHIGKELVPAVLLKEAASVVIDSRKAEPDCIFIATKGERVDGHSFIPQVLKAGALGIVCEQEPAAGTDGCFIVVQDSFQALKDIAQYYRSVLPVKTVGITGSVGKTSTKEMIASVLSKRFFIWKTAGNFNNEVGVPLTIFGIREEHEIAVLEMGISDFGEMDRLSRIVRPDVCVMTNIGPCHLENLKSLDGVLKAKSEIFHFMDPDGTVCINGDDEKLKTIREVNKKPPVCFGRGMENDVYATDLVSHGLEGTSCTIHTKAGVFDVKIPLPGSHMADNALAAAAVGLVFSMTPDEIKRGIESVEGMSGRSHLIRTENYLLVDDCYNANPKAMQAAIDLLSQAEGRKVAILGDMFELGEDSDQLHAKTGRYAAVHAVDVLLCVGTQSKYMYEAATAIAAGNDMQLYYYESREELLEKLRKEALLQKGDTILIKASHGMGFEKVVEFLQTYGIK